MGNKRFKKITGQIHLYLGLVSGIIVLIVSLTGCFWVFQEEFTQLIEGERKVQIENKPFISPEKAKQIAQEVFPEKQVHGTVYGHSSDPLEVIFYEVEPEFYQSVFLNPYSGEVLEIKNHRSGFFWFVLKGHLYLWLPKAIGTELTRYGTMVFVILLITGIILWWPKNKKGRKQRMQFLWKSSTRWRRKNFDLHSILGFYISSLALIIAFSGLVMAFDWVYFVTYKTWGGDKTPQFLIPNNLTQSPEADTREPAINFLFAKLVEEYPEYESFELHYPHADSSSIYVEISSQSGVYYNSDYRFFDQYTLEEIETPGIYGKYNRASIADKVMRMNYDIHVGAIGGLPGKIIAFFISLLAASLPITGFLLWWGRNKKSKISLNSEVNEPKRSRPLMQKV
ncbi:PepSY-associated TM helix domain-containing protein [Flexithrix dorotheae]|uniref:PepSY-associated TM helix domain-containing protein n=1 Tax=Flexithrix dorotheae TaxID=70993 RepID=UPI0012FCA496|nr:PepSY-associated TM helix domain-containing protein [Flexithrix dorotheae]